jgi:hypothetical protein
MSASLSREVGRKRGHSQFWDGRGRPFPIADFRLESEASDIDAPELQFDLDDFDFADDDFYFSAELEILASLRPIGARWACAHIPVMSS